MHAHRHAKGRDRREAGPLGLRRGQGSEGGGAPKMAASMCDVFSFCVGVAGPARVSVEVRFVSSAKVRPGRIPLGVPTLFGLGDSPRDLDPRGPRAAWMLRLSSSRPGGPLSSPCLRPSRGEPWPLEPACVPPPCGSPPAYQRHFCGRPGPPGLGWGHCVWAPGNRGWGRAGQGELTCKTACVFWNLYE